jgi:uncharacterized MAPEG superfamily protein
MQYVTAVAMLALIEYFVFSMLVGKARGQYGVPAPKTVGDDNFERYFRAQSNTGEALLLFIPGLFAFGYYVNSTAAAVLGLVFIAGRAWYFRTYIADPASRGNGMMVTVIASMVLVVGGLVGALLAG